MNLLQKQIRLGIGLFLVVATFTFCLIVGGISYTHAATSGPTWNDVLGAKVQTSDESGATWKSWYLPHCRQVSGLIEDGPAVYGEDVCYNDTQNGQLGVYRHSSGDIRYVVRYSGETMFHRIEQLAPDNSPNLALLSNDMLIGSFLNSPMLSMGDFRSKLLPHVSRLSSTVDSTSYSIDMRGYVAYTDDVGTIFQIRNMAVSKNERFAVVQTPDYGLVRIDLNTHKIKRISNDRGNDSAGIVLAIANDGGSVAITGSRSSKHQIYTDLDNCGASTDIKYPLTNRQICPHVDFTDKIIPQVSYGTIYNPEFLDDSQTFVLHVWNEEDQRSRKVVLTPDENSYRLDYLALGDSYSSGEGDIGRDANGKDYYVPETRLWPDDCHISLRSYPFLLRNNWDITSNRMQSVACSGAQVMPDYNGSAVNYLGQKGRLTGKSNLEVLQHEALIGFIPGYVPQLEFVKKYQPKIVTLMGGGNDVGFADILEYCAEPTWEGLVPFINTDCGYANEGSELEKLLYRTIDTQYTYTKNLIEDIKQTSPTTKIVQISYPSFIADKDNKDWYPCVGEAGFLSPSEIRMVNRMVDYMNSMLQRVAHDTGITYVDITHALDGGRLCEGSKYMTGVRDFYVTKKAVENEIFHPNAEGHKRMAEVIERAKVYRYEDVVPDSGSFDLLNDGTTALMTSLVQSTTVTKTSGLKIRAQAGSLEPNSEYKITIYSAPKILGRLIATDDGSITANISLSGVESGNHVIVIDGVDEQGTPKQLFQFIQVKASEADADGDGVPDNQDQCPYTAHWYDEQTGKDVCTNSAIQLSLALESNKTSKSKLPDWDNDHYTSVYMNSEVTSAIPPVFRTQSKEQTINRHQKFPSEANYTIAVAGLTFMVILSVIGWVYEHKKLHKR